MSDTTSVSARLRFDIGATSRAMLQVAPAAADAIVEESLLVTVDGNPVDAGEVQVADLGRAHVFGAEPGVLEVSYEATIRGGGPARTVSAAEEIFYLRPSRYAESDRLSAVARAEFAGIAGVAEILAAVSSWVGTHLSYVPGSSQPTDGAVETLLSRQGVCRDFAHLAVAMLRALDIPARLVAVYAPGLQPMDFHAVAEAAIDGSWYVVDPTLLAPRSSLVRICHGRDAADTAFVSTYGGSVQLLETEVSARVDGDLPGEDVTRLVALS